MCSIRKASLRLMSVALVSTTLPYAVNLTPAWAQAAPAAARQLGTVKTINGSSLSVAGDKGEQATITLTETTRVLQLAPGSTDLKTAQPATAADIAVGDRILATGKAGDGSAIEASRVILMKSGDIAQKRAAEQADWVRRGSGGLVSAVNGSTIAVKAGQRTVSLTTTPKTIFRRYAADSIKFEDAVPGTLSQIKAGDQLRVRGERSAEGDSITADEIVSGAFRNLAGTINSVDAATGKIVIKDLESKKNVTVTVTSNSDFRTLPPQMATMLAARARGAAPAAPNGGSSAGGSPVPSAAPSTEGAPAGGSARAGFPRGEGFGPGGPGGPGAGRPGGRGMDLASMLARMPAGTLASLKSGDALMIVGTSNGDTVTAVTMLSGVEPILAAPNGAQAMNLSPWSMGGGGGEGGGEGVAP